MSKPDITLGKLRCLRHLKDDTYEYRREGRVVGYATVIGEEITYYGSLDEIADPDTPAPEIVAEDPTDW